MDELPAEDFAERPPADQSCGSDQQVDVEIGRIRVSPEVATWLAGHVRDHEPQGSRPQEVISDLFAAMYREDSARKDFKACQQAQDAARRAALSALTEEQRHNIDIEQAFLNLSFGMAEVESGLRIAERLGQRIRWLVDGIEVAAPDIWPRPELAHVPSAFAWTDDSVASAGVLSTTNSASLVPKEDPDDHQDAPDGLSKGENIPNGGPGS